MSTQEELDSTECDGSATGRTDRTHDSQHKRLKRVLLMALGVFLPLGLGVDECERVPIGENCAADGGTATGCDCQYQDERHANGEAWKTADGCNECSCQDGLASCTHRTCMTPPKPCGGIAGLQCPDNQYCDFAPDAACGAADQTGTCKSRAEICPQIYAPVCGCDDKTYGSACQASSSGTSVASEGECGSAAAGCDDNGQHHAVGESYLSSDGCNTCTCGANGLSACTLKACVDPPACGSRGQAACATDQYCNFPIDAQCGSADLPGVCATVPKACTKEYNPVCGCDDKTYGNACTAAAAGVSVLHKGACDGCEYEGDHHEAGATFPSSDGCNTCTCDASGSVSCTERACPVPSCGGLTGAACPKGQYCDFPAGALCGAADATGTCKATPMACTREFVPVCGCDDKTYGNACEAASAGVSARAQGECGTTAGGCDYNGQHYAAGAGFPSSDGCNSCSCADNGMVICTLRACAPQKTCGGFAGLQCAATEYCSYAADANCGFADQSGVCQPKPDVCDTIAAPVCGCDGKTYSSTCVAARGGTSTRSMGACP